MKRKSKRNIIISSALTLALSLSIATGATYALFTSEATTNIAITSGRVDVSASISELSAYSPKSISSDGTIKDDTDVATNDNDTHKFYNGGSAVLDGGDLTLTNMTPGDKVTFKISITNNSNVGFKYRVKFSEVTPEGVTQTESRNFLSQFKIIKDSSDFTSVIAYQSNWEAATGETAINDILFSIELPTTVSNEYQNKSTTIAFSVEAVQGNAETTGSESTTKHTILTGTTESVQSSLSTIIKDATSGSTTSVTLPEGNYTISASDLSSGVSQGDDGKKVEITGSDGTTLTDPTETTIVTSNADLVLSNLTLEGNNANYNGYQVNSIEYNNCTLTGKQQIYSKEVTYNNCEFKNSTDYCVWVYSRCTVNFNNCTFTTGGKAILVYNEATSDNFIATVNINDCKFTSDYSYYTSLKSPETVTVGNTTYLKSYAAISCNASENAKDVNGDKENKYYINITNSKFTNFGYTKLSTGVDSKYATHNTVIGNKKGMDENHLFVTMTNCEHTPGNKVTVNGVDYSIADIYDLD